MSQGFLFIGGPADGQRLEVPYVLDDYIIATHTKFYAPTRPLYDPSIRHPNQVSTESPSFKTTRYRKRRFADSWLFVEESMNQADVMEMLIKGYNPQPPVSPSSA